MKTESRNNEQHRGLRVRSQVRAGRDLNDLLSRARCSIGLPTLEREMHINNRIIVK